GRAGAALEHPPLRRHPVRRRSGRRQPGRVRRRQPGWQPPHDPTMVQPAPALLTMNHPDRPREDTTMRPPRTAWIAALALAIGLALPAADTPAQERGALPEQGRVVSGKAELRRKERSLTVTQRTQRAILEWRSFDIGADASVTFVQPSRSSVALNRVVGGKPSMIAGRLSSNGHVFLVNGAGVMFAPGAQVDVGRLVTTGMDVDDDEFMAGSGLFEDEI